VNDEDSENEYYQNAEIDFEVGDYANALRWLRIAADEGFEKAKIWLDELWRSPLDTEAVESFRLAAEAGDEEARGYLYFMYSRGVRDKRGLSDELYRGETAYKRGKYKEAMELFRIVAEHGDPEGEEWLDIMYLNGEGEPEDEFERYHFYRDAARDGYVCARFRIATLCAYGIGTKKDEQMAVAWLLSGTERLIEHAKIFLGYLYAAGSQIEADEREAAKWFRRAADEADDERYLNAIQIDKTAALVWIGDLFFMDLSDAPAAEWYRRAAALGNAQAQYKLGLIYLRDQGISQCSEEAMRWLELAAQQRHVPAWSSLGAIYENGEGVAKDIDEAARWYRLAAYHGDEWSRERLRELEAIER